MFWRQPQKGDLVNRRSDVGRIIWHTLLRRRQEGFDLFLEQPDIVVVRTLHTAKRRCEQIQQESWVDQFSQLVPMGHDQLRGAVRKREQLVETRQLQQLR